MKVMVKIFVEGIADVVFLRQYVKHLYGIELEKDAIINVDGWEKIKIGFMGALMGLILLSPIFIGIIVLLYFANNKRGLTPNPSPQGEGDKQSHPSGGGREGAHWWNRVFFTQDRPGKNERIFKALKFNTMTDEHDASGTLLPDADRLTPVGRFVRSTSIDEPPQLVNVLKGDMALIGLRPLLVQYLPLYSPEQARRHEVRLVISGC